MEAKEHPGNYKKYESIEAGDLFDLHFTTQYCSRISNKDVQKGSVTLPVNQLKNTKLPSSHVFLRNIEFKKQFCFLTLFVLYKGRLLRACGDDTMITMASH